MNFNAAQSRSRQSGVTLVELIVTMTIAGILLAMGVSSYKYVTKSNRAAGEINGLLGDLQFARYEAVKEGESVTVCPAGATATTCAAATTTWSGGWIVLSNALATSGTATVLRRQLPFSSLSAGSAANVDTLTSTVSSVLFNREGFASGLAGAGLTGTATFTLHDSATTASYTRCLMLGVSGVMQTGLSGATILGKSCT